jgi:hypothetical protein
LTSASPYVYGHNGKAGKLDQSRRRPPAQEGPGFSIELSVIPLDGRLIVLPPDDVEENLTK